MEVTLPLLSVLSESGGGKNELKLWKCSSGRLSKFVNLDMHLTGEIETCDVSEINEF
jgi:hypothetical protein